MFRPLAHPLLIRSTLWVAAAMAAVLAFVLWGGGLNQLMEYINDIF